MWTCPCLEVMFGISAFCERKTRVALLGLHTLGACVGPVNHVTSPAQAASLFIFIDSKCPEMF